MDNGPAKWTDTNIKGRTKGMSPWIIGCTSLREVIPHILWICSRASFASPNISAQRNFNDVARNRNVCIIVCSKNLDWSRLCSRWLSMIKEGGNLFPGFYFWKERGCQHRCAHQEECVVHQVRVCVPWQACWLLYEDVVLPVSLRRIRSGTQRDSHLHPVLEEKKGGEPHNVNAFHPMCTELRLEGPVPKYK